MFEPEFDPETRTFLYEGEQITIEQAVEDFAKLASRIPEKIDATLATVNLPLEESTEFWKGAAWIMTYFCITADIRNVGEHVKANTLLSAKIYCDKAAADQKQQEKKL